MTRTDRQPRTARSLDGEWQFLLDPENDGVQQGFHDPNEDWSDEAETVTVPHSWQEDETHRDYTGTAWYRTTVDYDGHGDRVFLQFDAVDYEATVYVDGEEVGTHRDGYLPFEVEVSDVITPGETVVAVEVTDPEDLGDIPHGKQGEPWYTRVSGIWQSVSLESRAETFVTDVKATPDLDDDTVTLDIAVDGDAADADVTITKDGNEVATTTCSLDDDQGACTLSIPDADYWTPETPHLYDVTVTLTDDGDTVDVYEDYFGMRSVSADPSQLYLNGEPLYIRGALDQAYYPDTLYRPFEEDLFEYEIEKAKELGFNMLRKHIKPAHPDFIEAADRLGILVWEEPANPDRYTERSRREVRDQFYGMVDRDYNSPSVVIWSLYNEEWGIGQDQVNPSGEEDRLWNDEEKQEYLTEFYREAAEEDPTRLICDNSGWAHVATDINDYHEYFVSPDRAQAWADDLDDIVENPEDNYAVENTPAAEAPILISEFGTWGFPDLPKLRDHYDGDPTWFSHDFLEDPLKRPEGVDDRYEATTLPDVFDGYDELAEAWQERESVSLQGVIEEMRTNDGIAGYVVTEFSDIEWEFNGILDYFRDPKTFVDEFATINEEVLVSIDPDSHVVAPGEDVTVDVHVVNDTNDTFEGELRWEGVGAEGSQSITIDGYGNTTFEQVLTLSPSADAETGPQQLEVSLETDDRSVTNEEPIVVVGSEAPVEQSVYADEPLASALEANSVTVTAEIADADVAIVTDFDDEVSAFAEQGKTAIVVPEPDGRMAENDRFEYRNLPAAESWNLVASFLYQDSDLVDDLCSSARVGWAFEDLFPHDLASDIDTDDEVHVGSVEGWIANWGSPLVTREHGDGRVCSCSFRVTDAYGDHPTATALVDRLLHSA